jgi:hypothetical protein
LDTNDMRETTFVRLILTLCACIPSLPALAQPETVDFQSADGKTQIVGYLFKPDGAGPHPAVVLLHGRAGPYSANSNADCTLVAPKVSSACNGATLSKRHAMWGQYWAEHGYVALLPDSFGPRGKAHGFGRFSHGDTDRDDVNEKTVRPLDAEGALAYLRGRKDVLPEWRFDHAECHDPTGLAAGLSCGACVLSRLWRVLATRANSLDISSDRDVPG